MYCFNFFRNQLLWHLNSIRNVNMCLLEVAMFEKCRSSHFQSEGESKKFEGGLPIFLGGEGVTFAGGGSVRHYRVLNYRALNK